MTGSAGALQGSVVREQREPSAPIRILVADRNRMGSQLLAESLGRDPCLRVDFTVNRNDEYEAVYQIVPVPEI
jgi:hypothetical protein